MNDFTHPQHLQRQLRDRLLGVEARDVAAKGHQQQEEGVGVALFVGVFVWWCVCAGGD